MAGGDGRDEGKRRHNGVEAAINDALHEVTFPRLLRPPIFTPRLLAVN